MTFLFPFQQTIQNEWNNLQSQLDHGPVISSPIQQWNERVDDIEQVTDDIERRLRTLRLGRQQSSPASLPHQSLPTKIDKQVLQVRADDRMPLKSVTSHSEVMPRDISSVAGFTESHGNTRPSVIDSLDENKNNLQMAEIHAVKSYAAQVKRNISFYFGYNIV